MNIYVGNLSFKTTEDGVRELFAAFGQVDRVSLISDRQTGRPRGFGFVEMADTSAGQAAIEALDGKDVDGRKLKVNEAQPKPERAGRGGGGDYGRGR
ncbi:MAG: RNA-binding protein [Planctomycetes bacterium]|nr:RNA-binding protein [Planctomycetota bacterium]